MSEPTKHAFPNEWSTFEYKGDSAYCRPSRIFHHNNGMTLRDYFAGQALSGLVSATASAFYETMYPSPERNIAKNAYLIADAMIEFGNKLPIEEVCHGENH